MSEIDLIKSWLNLLEKYYKENTPNDINLIFMVLNHMKSYIEKQKDVDIF